MGSSKTPIWLRTIGPALSEITATRPGCARADFRRDHRPQDPRHRAQIRACGNEEEIQGDQQAACNSPGSGLAVDPASRGLWAEGPRVHNLIPAFLRL